MDCGETAETPHRLWETKGHTEGPDSGSNPEPVAMS